MVLWVWSVSCVPHHYFPDFSQFELDIVKTLYERKLCLLQKLEGELSALASIIPQLHRYSLNKGASRKRTYPNREWGE
jgi:hypothetical protein